MQLVADLGVEVALGIALFSSVAQLRQRSECLPGAFAATARECSGAAWPVLQRLLNLLGVVKMRNEGRFYFFQRGF
jgi:hypothetical protein